MKQLLTILLLLFIQQATLAQHDLGVKASGGSSYLITKHFLSPSLTTQTFYLRPSAQGGIFYNFNFGNRSLLGAEVLLSQIEGKEHNETPQTDANGNTIDLLMIGDISRHISYLSVPVYYGYNINKLNINIGVQTSFKLTASAQAKSTVEDANGGYTQYFLKTNKLPIKDYDIGGKLGLSFNFTTRLALEATYYYGCVNIYKYDLPHVQYKIQQATIGLRYKFLCSDKKEVPIQK